MSLDQSARRSRRTGLMVVLALAGAALLMVILLAKPGVAPGPAHEPRAANGGAAAVSSRTAQDSRQMRVGPPRSGPPQFTVGSLPPPTETAATPATDVAAAIKAGDWRWSATLVQLEDLGFVGERRVACGKRHGSSIQQSCNYWIDMRVRRTGPDRGTIVQASSEVMDEAPEDGCPELAACIAEIRVQQDIPLPPGEDKEVRLTQALQSTPMPARMKTRAHVLKILDLKRGALDMLRDKAAEGDPEAAHQLATQEASVRYLEGKLREL